MKAMIFALLLASGFSAQAHHNGCHSGQWTNLSTLSCAAAKRSVAQTGGFYRCTGDGPIPIVVEQNPRCGRRSFLAPYPVATADNRQCVVGFFCQQGN